MTKGNETNLKFCENSIGIIIFLFLSFTGYLFHLPTNLTFFTFCFYLNKH